MKSPSLCYKILGDISKPSIILLHGFLGSKEDWSDLSKELISDYRLVLIDLPGHGKSIDLDDYMYSIDSVCEQIKLILDIENIQHCIVLGYSMGGRIALNFAEKNNKFIDSLILISSSFGIENIDERQKRIESDLKICDRIMKDSQSDFLNFWYNLDVFEGVKQNNIYDYLIKKRSHYIKEEIVKSLQNSGTGTMNSFWNTMDLFQFPIHYLYGSMDKKYSKIAKEIKAKSKLIRLYEIENCGHIVFLEQKYQFIQTIIRILNN
jgi:2-succinyl-6-hydroxy-2,4-cyclohexadiene-1-carboxylate synthase